MNFLSTIDLGGKGDPFGKLIKNSYSVKALPLTASGKYFIYLKEENNHVCDMN